MCSSQRTSKRYGIECRDVPLFDPGTHLLSEFSTSRNINLWSLEYLIATSTRLLDIVKCSISTRKGGISLSREEVIERIIENVAKGYRCSEISETLRRANEFLEETARGLIDNGYYVREVVIELASRGVIGASSDFGRLLFEWGLAFDPYLNLPYIPASTLKGAVRSAYLKACKAMNISDRECRVKADELFGSTESAGKIGFSDAYPIECTTYLIVPDVITPHYAGGKSVKYEKDAMPEPIRYLSINKGVKFKFLIFHSKDVEGKELIENPNNVRRVDDLRLLDRALLLSLGLGVGGKTLSGYSQFKIVSYTKKYIG